MERFWSKLKQYRRVAARYEKKAENFLAFVQVASIMILLKEPKSLGLLHSCPHGLFLYS